jgi:hypothetical protein
LGRIHAGCRVCFGDFDLRLRNDLARKNLSIHIPAADEDNGCLDNHLSGRVRLENERFVGLKAALCKITGKEE